jgi:hypothetical protein
MTVTGAHDGFLGYFAGEEAPDAAVGQNVRVWIANVSPPGYTLTPRRPRDQKQR